MEGGDGNEGREWMEIFLFSNSYDSWVGAVKDFFSFPGQG